MNGMKYGEVQTDNMSASCLQYATVVIEIHDIKSVLSSKAHMEVKSFQNSDQCVGPEKPST